MNLNPQKAISSKRPARRAIAAFTLAEVLAAMIFMAILVPVTVEAYSVASRAGDVAHRKILALRVAEQLLNQTLIDRNWNLASRSGSSHEGNFDFDWTVHSDLWNQDTMQEVTAEVRFLAQGHQYAVNLTTLMLYQ